jgi:hypothetical protein
MNAIVHLSSTVLWLPVLLPERCAGVAASAYRVLINHVDGARLQALSPQAEVIARKACSMRRSSVRGSDDEMAESA